MSTYIAGIFPTLPFDFMVFLPQEFVLFLFVVQMEKLYLSCPLGLSPTWRALSWAKMYKSGFSSSRFTFVFWMLPFIHWEGVSSAPGFLSCFLAGLSIAYWAVLFADLKYHLSGQICLNQNSAIDIFSISEPVSYYFKDCGHAC